MSKILENIKNFIPSIKENAGYFITFMVVIVFLFLIANLVEKLVQKKEGRKEKILTTRKIVVIGMFSALSSILMLFEIPMPFAPGFYKLDFSEVPILIGAFAFGPVAGVLMEFVKVLLNLLFDGTTTAFVGEFANFAVGCSFILPASIVYLLKKSKKTALFGCIAGTIVITIFGTAFNALYLLPAFAKLYGMPLDAILAMGSKVNGLVKEGSIMSFVMCCVAPLNLIKGAAVSIITMLVYKPLRPIIKGAGQN
ncbi:MAG: ECF transporter S component [Lachnospiraceae bacterium]|nr:ECF transporter S component [Lachnospiraceae bacterium]